MGQERQRDDEEEQRGGCGQPASGGVKPCVAMALHLQVYHGCSRQSADFERVETCHRQFSAKYCYNVHAGASYSVRRAPPVFPSTAHRTVSQSELSLSSTSTVRPSVLSPDALAQPAVPQRYLQCKSRCALHSVPNLKITSHYSVLIAEQQVPCMQCRTAFLQCCYV
jgi:hypothetical protein